MSDFMSSYRGYANYPTQLMHRGLYPSALLRCKTRLDEEIARGLCINDGDGTEVTFRDLDPSYPGPVKRNVYNALEIAAWLDYQSDLAPLTNRPVSQVTKSDPRCRFIYFHAENTREPLKVNKSSLTQILTYHQVMPSYLDFIYVFGKQEKVKDLGFGGFRQQTLLNDASHLAVPHLGRSGRQYQMCYNLKAPYHNKTNDLWSIRPAVIHHQLDIVNGNSLWIITKGNLELKKRIESMTGPGGRPEDRELSTPASCLRSSLAVHCLITHWAGEDWRWRIQALEAEVDHTTFEAIDLSRAKDRRRHFYTPDELITLQGIMDKITEVIMVLEANKSAFVSIRKYYDNLLKNKHFTLSALCADTIDDFATQMNEATDEAETHISRAKVLAQIAADRKTIILQHLESQATEQVEAVTRSMYKVGVLSQTEAAVMRIITVLTLLYLPATFVSTFFSTDVVKYQNSDNGGGGSSSDNGTNPTNSSVSSGDGTSFSSLAMVRWLEVTIPLTIITSVFAYIWYRRSLKRVVDLADIGDLPVYQKSLWKDSK